MRNRFRMHQTGCRRVATSAGSVELLVRTIWLRSVRTGGPRTLPAPRSQRAALTARKGGRRRRSGGRFYGSDGAGQGFPPAVGAFAALTRAIAPASWALIGAST